MALSAGTRLGPYEIVAPIGAGGMGEVYRARDSRLSREVAIKVSSQQFTERFEREARAIAFVQRRGAAIASTIAIAECSSSCARSIRPSGRVVVVS